MPGYVIHLTEAKIICDMLKNGSQIQSKDIYKAYTEQEAFYYGSLLPDAGGKSRKPSSHFWNESEKGKIIMTPYIENFLKKYAAVLKKDSLYQGYLAHLCLDRDFWKNYIKANVEFWDSDGRQTESVKDLRNVWIKKTNTVILPEEFFSKNYLYGDYTRLNKLLIKKHRLVIPGYNADQNNKIKEADNEKMKNVLEHLETYIENSLIDATEMNLRVLSLHTLETFLRESAQQFIELYSTYLD